MMKYLVSVILALITTTLSAQSSGKNNPDENLVKVDSTYIEQYTSELDLTTRFYSSVKFSRYNIKDKELGQRLDYASNENLILGVGFNYKRATFNLGLNFPFVNSWDHETKGETKYLDAQIHYYLDHYVFDAWLSTYKGYYLTNPWNATTQSENDSSFPIRPDIRNTNISFSLTRILNPTKFSFRASFAQDEWQKKSAGSFLVGGEYNMMFAKGDSSFIPTNVMDSQFFGAFQMDKMSIFNVGINGGYGHTFVIRKHFFFSLVGVCSFGAAYTILDSAQDGQETTDGVTWNLNYSGKVGIGYNSKSFYVGLTTVQAYLSNRTPIQKGIITENPGNIRLNFVKRFVLKKPLRLPIVNQLTK